MIQWCAVECFSGMVWCGGGGVCRCGGVMWWYSGIVMRCGGVVLGQI